MVFTARWNEEILSIGWRFPPVRGTSSCQEDHVSIFAREFKKTQSEALEISEHRKQCIQDVHVIVVSARESSNGPFWGTGPFSFPSSNACLYYALAIKA